MEDRNEVTQRILNLTLEIIYLLTGEDYIIVKKPGGRTTTNNRLQVVEGFCRTQNSVSVPLPLFVVPERSEEKILELTKKMMELLTGEVPIRCQDVTVYLSMEEWEYLAGHKDLYKNVMMEDEPDGSEMTAASGDNGCFPVTADCEGGDRMITDDGPEGLDICKGDPRPESQGIDMCDGDMEPEGVDTCEGDVGLKGIQTYEGHTTTSSMKGFQVHIKEEPLSEEEDGPAGDKPIPYTCVQIKEEPQMFTELPSDNADQISSIFGHIKVETTPGEEESCSTPNIYPSTDQGQSTAAPIKEEPATFISVMDISGHVDQTRVQASHTVPEPLAYEVGIPIDKAPVKGPDNASLYSVRQKEDSMEILYHCPSCYKGFSSNLDLARHQVIHTVDKLFICSLCGKSFTEMSFLVKHQVIHTDLKLCVCSVCGGCFYSETSLAKHQKTHSLPLFCSTCGKCFFNKTELAIHERKHSGERPFGCHVCGKHFIAKSVLNKHMLIHTSVDLRK